MARARVSYYYDGMRIALQTNCFLFCIVLAASLVLGRRSCECSNVVGGVLHGIGVDPVGTWESGLKLGAG